MRWWILLGLATILLITTFIVVEMMGAGGFKRMVTLTGIYGICKPGGYEAVCFLDADSKDGGLSCLPLAQVGGECRK